MPGAGAAKRLNKSSWPNATGMTSFNPKISMDSFGRQEAHIQIQCVGDSPCYSDLKAAVEQAQKVTADPAFSFKRDCEWVVGDKTYKAQGGFASVMNTSMNDDGGGFMAEFELVADRLETLSSA